MLIDTNDLLDAAQVAEVLGLRHRTSVSTYARRYSDFPEPVVVRGSGRVQLWSRGELERWHRHDGATTSSGERGATSEVHERIVTAAAEAMAAHPLQQLRMQEVAAAAEVSLATLYRFVSNREDLRRQVVEYAVDRIWTQSEVPGDPSWQNLVERLVTEVRRDPVPVRILVLALFNGDDLSQYKHPALTVLLLAAVHQDPDFRVGGPLTTRDAVGLVACLVIGTVVFGDRVRATLGRHVASRRTTVAASRAILELSGTSAAPTA